MTSSYQPPYAEELRSAFLELAPEATICMALLPPTYHRFEIAIWQPNAGEDEPFRAVENDESLRDPGARRLLVDRFRRFLALPAGE